MYILKGKDSAGLASTSFKTELLTLVYCRTDTQIPKIKKLFCHLTQDVLVAEYNCVTE